MSERRVAGLLRVALTAGFVGLAVTACGGGGGGPIASGRPSSLVPTVSASLPTRSAAPEASASRPSLAVPTRSDAATPAPNPTTADPTTVEPTTVKPTTADPTTLNPTTPNPAPAPTRTAIAVPTQPSTAGPASTAAATPTSTPSANPVSSSSPAPWVWWLLGLLVAGALVALLVVAVRGRRARQAWDAAAGQAVGESRWLAHELLPNALSAQTAAARRDIWAASRPRLDALQRTLGALVASAPKDRLGTLDRLRDAVTDVSSALDAHTAPGGPGAPESFGVQPGAGAPDSFGVQPGAAAPESLGAARQAQRQLEEALRAMQPRQ